MAISSAARATMNAITPKVIEVRNVNIPRAFLDTRMQPVNLIAAHNYEHRSNRTQCPLSTRVLTGSSRAWMRDSIACTKPTSSEIIKLGTYVIFERIIREAVWRVVMGLGSNRRFKALRVVSVCASERCTDRDGRADPMAVLP